MKVTFINKTLLHEYYTIISIMSVISSLIFLFIDISEDKKAYCLIIFLAFLIIVFLVLWSRANKLKKLSLKINNSIVEIRTGDIFCEDGIKIIPFNEFYDTQVDDILISKNTLNGKYITHFYYNPSELDTIINLDRHSTKCIISSCKRKSGKTKQYKLGTIIKNGDYFLLAFSHFDSNNRAYLKINDYINCLMNMWDQCDIHYGGNTIVTPLLGSGITRFHGNENINDQELLELIIWTFKFSHIRFQYPAKAKIIITDESLSKINLYDIKTRFKQ